MHSSIYLIIIGLIAGGLSGLMGIGGGIIIIPALIYMFGLTQHQAQGTTLAIMIPPIGLLAAIRYYQYGNVNIYMALYVCLGFFFGGLIGAIFSHSIPDLILKKIFGVVFLMISIKMILEK